MARRLPPLRSLLCALALLATLPSQLHAQDGPTRWQALGSPGGRVTLLAAAADGKVVFAVTVAEVNRNADQTQARETGTPARADALYKSLDGGRQWQAVTNDLPPGEITLLFVDRDDVVWVGAERQGEAARAGELWSSADGGESWRKSDLDGQDLALRNMTQDGQGDLLLLANGGAETVENLLYRRDAAGAWEGAQIELPAEGAGARCAHLTAHPVDAALYLTTESGDLLLSADGGRTWAVAGDPDAAAVEAPAQFAFLAGNERVALLARSSEGGLTIERTADGGESWSKLRPRGLPSAPAVPTSLVGVGGEVVLLTTDRGVYRSVDAGATWQALEGALDSGYVYQILSPGGEQMPPSPLLAGTAYGLFSSQDGGAIWRPAGGGLPANAAVLGLLTHPARPEQLLALVRAVGAAEASLMLVSRDGGATWLPAGAGAWKDATAWANDPQNPDHLYLAGSDYVATSKDAGVSWAVSASLSSARRTSIAVAPSEPERVYVDGAPALISKNGGETWSALPSMSWAGAPEAIRGVAVDPTNAEHVWFGTQDGARESRDGGTSADPFGLEGSSVRWLTALAGDSSDLTLFAGAQDGGIMRWSSATGEWEPRQTGLPAGSNILAFAAAPGLLWATRDGGGLYASADGGANWQNAGRSAGENLGLSLAGNYSDESGWSLGTATAGIWVLGPERLVAGATQTPPGPTSAPAANSRDGVDARIEVVWPHDYAPLEEATLANVGFRLFLPSSLEVPSCGWRPGARLWRAVNTEPAAPVAVAEQRAVDGQDFPYWDANDVDVSPAQAPDSRVYFFVQVDGVDTATSVWAHGADARTYFPEQLVPSGIATGAISAVDARIQIVWPHDENGVARDVKDATLANVAVTLFKHGTRLSVPPLWRPEGITLMGAWNSEVSRPFDVEPVVSTRRSGAITFPVWEFYDVPVDRAREDANKLYLWTVVAGAESYPTIWAHGADARTFFPVQDEPVRGCLP